MRIILVGDKGFHIADYPLPKMNSFNNTLLEADIRKVAIFHGWVDEKAKRLKEQRKEEIRQFDIEENSLD